MISVLGGCTKRPASVGGRGRRRLDAIQAMTRAITRPQMIHLRIGSHGTATKPMSRALPESVATGRFPHV
jgi:hypothetical protein